MPIKIQHYDYLSNYSIKRSMKICINCIKPYTHLVLVEKTILFFQESQIARHATRRQVHKQCSARVVQCCRQVQYVQRACRVVSAAANCQTHGLKRSYLPCIPHKFSQFSLNDLFIATITFVLRVNNKTPKSSKSMNYLASFRVYSGEQKELISLNQNQHISLV